MSELGNYLLRSARTPWDWGGASGQDCCTFMAGWVLERGRPDPMAFIRGRYDSERTALRRIKEGGGLIPLWQRGMSDAGVPEVDTFEVGDVAIVPLSTEDGLNECCALFARPRWVCRTTQGLFSFPGVPFKAWRP